MKSVREHDAPTASVSEVPHVTSLPIYYIHFCRKTQAKFSSSHTDFNKIYSLLNVEVNVHSFRDHSNLWWCWISDSCSSSCCNAPTHSHDCNPDVQQVAQNSHCCNIISHVFVICNVLGQFSISKVNGESGRKLEVMVMWSPCLTSDDSLISGNQEWPELPSLGSVILWHHAL